ncbi:ABC transporter ATP-binding protein [Actinoplanes couchii]|uniref:ABC transporter ATP-binding protein n=1 Tax=Actinoplanes couchii TaxID=403638 RepID=A0ABQ3XDY6_9ACTN|nr:ABC transporter ATP-binding protein [Actinoplanes couchii]MDR6317230.1 ABC-2 type transport system ATP-binding protein [Actinoplanes couchii]GID56722.1 ABC transporter ATP-binding protein [Actinoplanes couchii]
MNDVAVRLSGIGRRFGAVRALDGLDLTIERGSVVALLGPNGAGKTTAVSIMLGLTSPGTGTVTVFGQTPAAAVRAGRVGAMMQDAGVVPVATVREVVELARSLYPDPLPLDRLLHTAGLTDLAGRRWDRLSGGEAQRVRFGFALAGAPELLVLDEPTTAMDVAARDLFWETVHSYAADGHTVLFSTHQLHEADRFADRIVVLAAGRLVADGSPAEIRALAGGRTVAFDRDGTPADDLAGLPGVRSVEIRGDRVVLTTDDADTTDAALAGRGFRGLEVTGSLDAAFKSLTTGKDD